MKKSLDIEYTILREVKDKDCKLIYDWANDEETRNNSFSPQKIKYEDHVNWFKNKLIDKKCYLFILVADSIDIGLIRVDIENKTGIISYSISSCFRGSGYGFKIVKLLEDKIVECQMNIQQLCAEVKYDNIASQKIFQKAGYVRNMLEDKLMYLKKI